MQGECGHLSPDEIGLLALGMMCIMLAVGVAFIGIMAWLGGR